MTSIRENVFETNSSSVHSLTICSKDDYQDWENGKLILLDLTNELITKEELYDRVIEHAENDINLSKEQLSKALNSDYQSIYENSIKNDEYCLAHITKEDFIELFDVIFKEVDGYFTEDRLEDLDEEYYLGVHDFANHISEITLKNVVAYLCNQFSDIYSEEAFYDGAYEYYECFKEEKVVKGTEVIAFGYYGHD